MTEKEFAELMCGARKRIEELREKGWNHTSLTAYMVGMLTAHAGSENERTFTESQLKRLFDLVFEDTN